ncbi:MAG: hypothetical protein R3F56_25145 [Planctomycetota bacterium]
MPRVDRDGLPLDRRYPRDQGRPPRAADRVAAGRNACRVLVSPAKLRAGHDRMPNSRDQRCTVGLMAGVAALSAAVLGAQILETRLFSVMLWHHLTYMVVTVTLLGFAAGASLLSLAPRLGRIGGDPRIAVSLGASLFGLGLLASFVLLTHQATDTLDLEGDRTRYFWLFARYAYLVLPFACAGLAIAAALAEHRDRVHGVYFWNLLGSGAGSGLAVALLGPLNGQACLLALVALAGLGGAAAVWGMRGALGGAARALALLTALGGAVGALAPALVEPWLPLAPARSKALSVLQALFDAQEAWYGRDPSYPPRDPTQRRTVWGPICRIDTVPVPRSPWQVARDTADPSLAPRAQVHVFQDGDAPTVIWSHGYAAEVEPRHNLFHLAHLLLAKPDTLVIGPGGGNEVATALAAGATSVTAVDVNGDTLALLQGPFAAFTGHLYTRPEVHAVHAEGRSYVRRQRDADGRLRQFDLLSMSGTDTYAALASGSYLFSESYLYTSEAFDDFFAHLTDAGILQVLRFRFEPPRETLRVVVTAAQALQRLGVRDPRRHFLIVHQDDRQLLALQRALAPQAHADARAARLAEKLDAFARQPRRYGLVLARKRPFTSGEVEKIAAAVPVLDVDPAVEHRLAYDADAGVVPHDTDNAYGRALAALADGRAEQFFASYPYRVAPVSDDRPFFFDFYSLADVPRARSSAAVGYEALTGSEPVGRYVLLALLLQTAAATGLLVLAPLFWLRRGGATRRSKSVAYFGCLGAGYLLVEIATVQRFVLYLGHPTYSLTVNLTCFLVFSGLGSAAAGRFGVGRRGAGVAAAAVVVLLAAHALWLPGFMQATLAAETAARVLYSVLWTAPLALAMGIPFPTGLALLGRDAPTHVPWAIAINGATSVLASVLAVLLAMAFGFRAVLALAAVLYAVGVVARPGAAR